MPKTDAALPPGVLWCSPVQNRINEAKIDAKKQHFHLRGVL